MNARALAQHTAAVTGEARVTRGKKLIARADRAEAEFKALKRQASKSPNWLATLNKIARGWARTNAASYSDAQSASANLEKTLYALRAAQIAAARFAQALPAMVLAIVPNRIEPCASPPLEQRPTASPNSPNL